MCLLAAPQAHAVEFGRFINLRSAYEEQMQSKMQQREVILARRLAAASADAAARECSRFLEFSLKISSQHDPLRRTS
jgi:hypothetical protein